jgi:hypothetical protein
MSLSMEEVVDLMVDLPVDIMVDPHYYKMWVQFTSPCSLDQ